MVKPGGTKRKATMKKITNKAFLATTFSKRTKGLFNKVSEFCLLTQAQMAVLITPPSSNSNVSFFSFGHSSVDSIVNAYLTGHRPVQEEAKKDDHEDLGIGMTRKDLGLDLWWEDDRLIQSAANPEELADKISRMLMKINDLRSQDHHQVLVDGDEASMRQTESPDQTLVLPSGSQVCCNPDDDLSASQEQDQTLIPPSGMSVAQDKTLDLQSYSQTCCNPKLLDDDLPADYNTVMTEEQEQIMAICDSFRVPENSNNNNVVTEKHDQIMAVCENFSVPEIDLDQLIDFDFDLDKTHDASAFDAAFWITNNSANFD